MVRVAALGVATVMTVVMDLVFKRVVIVVYRAFWVVLAHCLVARTMDRVTAWGGGYGYDPGYGSGFQPPGDRVLSGIMGGIGSLFGRQDYGSG